MSMPGGPQAPLRYELRIEGHLDEYWSTWFDGFAVIHADDGTTTLSGVVTDQAALHGLLAKVRDLGVTLVSLTPRAVAGDASGRERREHASCPVVSASTAVGLAETAAEVADSPYLPR